MGDEVVLRRHVLRQPSRFLLATVPFWVGAFLLGGVVVAATVVVPRVGEVRAATVAIDLVVLTLLFVGLALYGVMYRRTVREVLVWSDGDVTLRMALGGRRRLAAGRAGVEARVQQFLPQPGYVRVTDADQHVLYVGPFEDRDAVLRDLGVDPAAVRA